MRVVIAPDKFKGSLTAVQAAAAMSEGVLLAEPGADVVLSPMADGGEGTVEAIASATGASSERLEVSGPLPGQRVEASWALLGGRPGLMRGVPGAEDFVESRERVAVVEMAQASGFRLVPEGRRDPMLASTFGTGELIRAALDSGCDRIVVGIGGSATVDGGTGMAEALGYRFLDCGGNPLPGRGASLVSIERIDASGRDPRLAGTRFLVASDVDNPLLGESGAAAVFGPQKGATPTQVRELERGLRKLADAMSRDLGADVRDVPGAGAAGGLGAGLMAFCGARPASGVKLVAAVTGLEEKLETADLALTGEGSFDSQTFRGKTPAGVVELARAHGVPVVVMAGRLGSAAQDLPGSASFCILPAPMDLSEAMRTAGENLKNATARLMRLIRQTRGV